MPSADPVLILQPTSPPVLIAPITTPPVVIGPATSGGTLTGGGSAGEVAVWDASTDLTGDGAFLWDTSTHELSVTTGTGTSVRAGATGTTGLPLRLDQPSGATAHQAEGFVNGVRQWFIDAAGAFVGIVRLGWRVGGTLIGTRAHLNLIAGTGITLTPVDQSGTDAVDVTIDAALTGGGFASRVAYWDSATDLTGAPAFTFDDVAQTLTIYGATGGSTDPTVQAVAQSVGATPLQLQTPTGFTGKFLEWFINSVSKGAFPAAGGAYFNGAALSTSATSGFLGIPSCAGPPTGTPAGYPAGVVPLVWDSTNLQLYCYSGGAWKASAVFT